MLYGPLYFLCIPSGYLLLIIYFLCNMNNISWGTREVHTKKTKAQLEQEELDRIEAEKKKRENRLVNRLGISKMCEDLKELFSTMTGFRSQVNETENQQTKLLLKMCSALESLPDRINGKTPAPTPMVLKSSEAKVVKEPELIPESEIQEVIHHHHDEEEPQKPKRPPRDDLRNPAWLEDERLGDGQIMYINKKEAVFWRQLISKYLYPITMDKDQKSRLSEELKSLRNNVVFGFFMLNFLWIVIVFQFHLLQTSLNQDLFNKNGGQQLRNCTRMSENGLFIPIPRVDGTCVGIGMQFVNYYID
ncbi:hypothetical protein EB796_020820 [Bugula neritina]|uniref:Uncharacterized protein n=1 Tax=Bugula neritina TaxID=10212 RepID=A0A7J7J478_BUGNE|nr:hypothetical protein EB796_020820 [Bugula neritina]